ncbi:MAG TPA: MFS transporter [Pseudolysinimonas sp.]
MTSTDPDAARSVRVVIGQAVVTLAVFATNAAMISVLLPSRTAELDPEGKVADLAVALTIGAVVTALVQPVIGALSDRTHTRIGRRLPWMIVGATLGGLAVGLMGGASSIAVLALLWAIAQPSVSAVQVASDAFLVDAFPAERRGRAAGMVGIAVVVGSGVGAVFAGASAGEGTVFWALAGALVLAVTVFAVVVRDRAAPRPRPLLPIGPAVRAVSATVAAHPDYLKILAWRFGYSIAYGAVFAYLLYILTDLVGVGKDDAAQLIGLATVLGGAGALISVFLGGWLSDRLRRRRLFLLIGNGALIAGDLALLVSHTVPAALITATLFGLGLGLSISCGRALASQVLPDQADGAAAGLGVLNTAANVGQAVAPPIGALAIGLGGYPGALLTSIVGAIVCSVAVALVKTVR